MHHDVFSGGRGEGDLNTPPLPEAEIEPNPDVDGTILHSSSWRMSLARCRSPATAKMGSFSPQSVLGDPPIQLENALGAEK